MQYAVYVRWHETPIQSIHGTHIVIESKFYRRVLARVGYFLMHEYMREFEMYSDLIDRD